ncbi:MAG: ABC transporter ATP-binding protein, partial [Aeropyrum sp.]|nr:ABC transporter ATP-binding protein [Aeropyrum sp.]
MTSYAVEAEGLVKEYRMGLLGKGKTVRALDGVSLRIKTGELYSILGPNGAGKTTLIKILSTLLLPDSGYARVAGYDVVREADMVRMRIGVVLGGERALYWRLSAWDNLWFFSQLYGIPPGEARRLIRHLLDLVGLAEWANVRVENFSKGMKQRLHIARGLLNDPEVLLLDEPTIGLDPVAAREVRGIVRRVVSEGRTVILTTHYMWEAEELSDRVAIMGGGRILAEGSPEELRSILSA